MMPRATFCQPQVASFGLTEQQARDEGYDVKVSTFPFTANGKAHGLADPTGFVKLVADAKYNELLGGHLIPSEEEAQPGPVSRAGCVQLEVNASLEKGDLIAELADRYHQANRTFDGMCAAVSVHKKTSGAAMEALAAGWDAARDGSPAPQVWTPTSSLWLDLLRRKGTAADKTVLTDGASPSVTQSPLVIAMPKPMAEALGWPKTQIGWADVLALSADPKGWASKGHPEWGRFTFGKDNPHLSTSGLAATVATYYAASGRSSDLTEADLAKPEVKAFVGGVEKGVLHYADEALKFLSNFAEADAQGRAMSYVSAVVVQEELVHLYNVGNPTGNRELFGKGKPPQVPLVSLHPKDGTLMLDHPYTVLPSATAEQKAAAADFLAFVQEPDQQKRFAEWGFRNFKGEADAALVQSAGIAPDVKLSLIDPPSPPILEQILSGWDDLRKKAKVLLVFDVSGSMNDTAGAGKSKLEAAKAAAVKGLALLHPDDQVALWAFSTERNGTGAEPYAEVVPLAPLAQSRDRLTAAIQGLHAEGGTGLYYSVRAAQQRMLRELDPDRITAVVVLTDGKNEYPRDNDLPALLRDLDASNLERSVRVFAIAFGDKSDLGVLSDIAKSSRAAAYDARDPATIDRAFVSVLSNF
jgi:Ca-activated chloride channel family protein